MINESIIETSKNLVDVTTTVTIIAVGNNSKAHFRPRNAVATTSMMNGQSCLSSNKLPKLLKMEQLCKINKKIMNLLMKES